MLHRYLVLVTYQIKCGRKPEHKIFVAISPCNEAKGQKLEHAPR